jgi:hypothetical protein
MEAKYCTFKELSDGTYDMNDVWTMIDFLDLKEFVDAKAEEQMKDSQN